MQQRQETSDLNSFAPWPREIEHVFTFHRINFS